MATTPPINFSGLASGLDTTSIVSQLMQIERRPETRITSEITKEQARQQALKDVQTRLSNLSTAIATLRDPATWQNVQTVDSTSTSLIAATSDGTAAAGAHTLTVTQLARANQWGETDGGPTTAAGADVLHVTIGSGGSAVTKDFDILAGDSLATIAGRINNTSGSPVAASVVNSKLILSNKTTGTQAAITNVTTNGGSGLSFAQTQTAQDSVFTVDGTGYTRSSNTITDVLPLAGLTVTLKGLTTSSVSLVVGTSAPDKNLIQSKISDFVGQYNSTISYIRGRVNEAPVAQPQSDADLAKGVLYGDSGLTGLLSSLRAAVSDPHSGSPIDLQILSQAGLSTGATTGSGTLDQDAIAGRLSLDTDKLSDMLASRLDNVKALFTSTSADYGSKGLAQRLDTLVSPWLSGVGADSPIIDTRISTSQSAIDALNRRKADMETYLTLRQQRLTQQFTDMETALATLQSQQGQISSAIGTLGSLR